MFVTFGNRLILTYFCRWEYCW